MPFKEKNMKLQKRLQTHRLQLFFVLLLFLFVCLFVLRADVHPSHWKRILFWRQGWFIANLVLNVCFFVLRADVHPSHWNQILFWRQGWFIANIVLKTDTPTDKPRSNCLCSKHKHSYHHLPTILKKILCLTIATLSGNNLIMIILPSTNSFQSLLFLGSWLPLFSAMWVSPCLQLVLG